MNQHAHSPGAAGVRVHSCNFYEPNAAHRLAPTTATGRFNNFHRRATAFPLRA